MKKDEKRRGSLVPGEWTEIDLTKDCAFQFFSDTPDSVNIWRSKPTTTPSPTARKSRGRVK